MTTRLKQRRYGRQIPEWMVLSVAFSLSAIIGFPLAARLQTVYPEGNKIIIGALGLAVGFFLLMSLGSALGFLFGALQNVVSKRRKP